MRIGITVYLAQPLWESGANQTALQLGELGHALGHGVVFVHTGLHSWWDNYPIPSYATEHHYTTPTLVPPFDLLIDIDGTLDGKTRSILAPQTILFLRTFLQFTEMDKSVYIETPYRPRSTEQVTEVWCWDILNPTHTIPSVQTLFPCPIRRVPFFWSPTVTDYFTKKEVAFSFAPEPIWTIHVAEKNTNESSAVIPLVAIREAHQQGILKESALYMIHNLDAIKENRFLKENILAPIEISTLPATLAPRQPFYEWVQTANHVFFSHSRFTPLRISLLHLVWMGVPLFHNSTILRDLHPTLQNGFYHGNEISEWTAVLKQFSEKPVSWWADIEGRREVIRQKFGISHHLSSWDSILSSSASSASSPVSLPLQPPSPVKQTVIRIAFSDMWPGFNLQTNFLLDTLRHFYATTTFHGVLYSQESEADLIVVGPYEQTWRSITSSAPKIFFSAENWPIPTGPFSLCLLSAPQADRTHFRLPTWMTFIDWFTDSKTLPSQSTDNPIRLPLHFATHSHPVPFDERKEFCAFVVSNPTQTFRNEAFHALHSYKPVSSGGALYNNIGGPLALLYPGGGAGDISKHEFFTSHRFTLSAENAQQRGYITEKVLHAKMAGAVPLYWGDRDTDEDFAPNAIVNLSHLTNPVEIVGIVKKLEEHPAFCATIASTPILNQEKTEKAICLLRTMCSRIVELLPVPVPVSSLSPVPSPVPVPLFQSIYVINLDRRRDRWENLLTAEPYLASTATRISAVDGKTLQLTKPLYELFKQNHYGWKKGVIGCNLSHMMVWSKIASSLTASTALTALTPYTLVLEDDVRFQADWKERWTQAYPHVPADADLLYLGGVLPPNKPALPHALEAVNQHWSRIKPNTFFSQTPAPHFHFCAYSYILTPSGAKKLMTHLLHSKERYYTISDHMLGSPLVGLTKYVMTPLVTHCFQEDDPVYNASQFNQLERADTFDSDLWNNVDRFDPVKDLVKEAMSIHYMAVDDKKADLYENKWLEDLFGTQLEWNPLTIIDDAYGSQDSQGSQGSQWYLVQRPHAPRWAEWFKQLQQKGIPYRILHLSDEFATDPIEYYYYSQCKAVIRNYPRADLLKSPHIHVIPLGYHHKPTVTQSETSFSLRKWLWSFHGTDWFNRKEELAPLLSFQPNDCRLQPTWNHPTASVEAEYVEAIGQSKFCPILRGNNAETFRFYEALEAGALPVTTITDRAFLDTVEKELDLSSLYPWTEPEKALGMTEGFNEIQKKVQERWALWKERLRGLVRLTADPSS